MKTFGIILFFFFSVKISAQDKIKNLILSEFEVTQKIFNNSIFFELNFIPENLFEILQIDTFYLYIKDKKDEPITFGAKLYKVKIKLKCRIMNQKNNDNNRANDNLEYFIISEGNTLYKLFGFYSSDIKLLISKIGRQGLISLSENMVLSNSITKKKSKIFRKTIQKNRKYFPTKLNKPCQLLKGYFSKEEIWQANTLILPVKPLRPFST